MNAVWKYSLVMIIPSLLTDNTPLIATDVTLDVPSGSVPLTAQLQRGIPVLWMLVDPRPGLATEKRRVIIVGTGHEEVPEEGFEYLATLQLFDGDLVLHVFVEKLR